MKRILIYMLCLLQVLFAACGSGEADADERIRQLLASETYIACDLDGRKALAEELLRELQAAEAIGAYAYDEAEGAFGFSYPDGTPGVLQLIPPAEQHDQTLPMN